MQVTVESPLIRLPKLKMHRSPGIHVSSIIRCIAIEGKLLEQHFVEELELADMDSDILTDPVVLIRISMGLAWEQYYVPLIGDEVVDHPGEMKLDGVFMSPDAEELSFVIEAEKRKMIHYIHEVKCTYKSTNTVGIFHTAAALKKNWMWLAQIKSYCCAAKTLYAKLHVLFVCGDYSYPIRPQLKIFTFKFTQEELNENWALMSDYVFYRLQMEKR